MPRRNSRDPKTSAKARLGEELAKARESAGFSSQAALADHLKLDRSVIGKAESGERPPSDPVLAVWIEACPDANVELITALAELARSSDGPIPTWFESWVEAESAAYVLRSWSPIIVPALFEIVGYRRAVIEADGNEPERADALVTATVERQAVLSRTDPPEVVAIIHESVLTRLIGSAEIMNEQLIYLADLAMRPNISIHIVPSSVGAHAGLSGDLAIASGDGAPDVLHTDAIPEGHTTETRSVVRRAGVTFERVRRDALPCAPSRTLILEEAERWKAR
jgi:transcriptional regulator with XRE-family HTH domain